MILPRKIEPILAKLALQYPVVTVTGPRQSGKTTLCRKIFANKKYYSFENPDIRRRAINDPRGFLEELENDAILDEVQRIPEILSYIQGIVDEFNKPGMFILTGSVQFELLSNISQSLAGRTALLHLMPFSLFEAYASFSETDIDSILYKGFYPRIFDKELNPTEALRYYCSTYIERDVRSLLAVKDLNSFEVFLKLCAGRTGQLLNLSSIGIDCGVNHHTVKNWLSVLEASYIVFTLKPHFKNFNKRLVKSSKLYFMDCGLNAYLLDITQPQHLKSHPLKGNLFENFVIAELLKQRYNTNQNMNLYFWRDNTGHEIDLLYDFGTTVFPVEIKSGKTVSDDFFKNIEFYKSINSGCKKAAIIYGGDTSYREKDTWIVSYKDISIFENLDARCILRIPH
jgi:predicted AAA+ superfamily ATPase